MALKTDRSTLQTDISFFMNEAATRGGVVALSTGGSGAAMDQGAALVTYAAAPSGKVPIGVLLNDMVNIDLTRQHLNQHQDEVQKGGKVTLLKQGWVVTNAIATTPLAGDVAYFDTDGNLTTATTSDKVGRFLSSKDADDYCKVWINIT